MRQANTNELWINRCGESGTPARCKQSLLGHCVKHRKAGFDSGADDTFMVAFRKPPKGASSEGHGGSAAVMCGKAEPFRPSRSILAATPPFFSAGAERRAEEWRRTSRIRSRV